MNVKEFLRPTKSKVIIAIIFFLLLPIPVKIPIYGCSGLKGICGAKYSWIGFFGFFFSLHFL